MPFLLVLIVGGAAGVIIANYMKLNLNIYASMGLGVLGALVGIGLIRFLFQLAAGMSGVLTIFVGGLIGSFLLVYLYRLWKGRG